MSVLPIRPIPNLTGETRIGDTIMVVDTDTKRVAAYALPEATYLVKLSVCCDGAGGGAPTTQALVRGVVYQNDVLLGMGDEVVVESGAELEWRDLPLLTDLDPAGILGLAGSIEYGVIVGGDPSVLRVAQIDPLAPGSRWNADTYANGASDPFGSSTPLTGNMSIFATGSPIWNPRLETPPDQLARMAWPDAQAFLTSAALSTPVYQTAATWHGTVVDPNRGSFAVVRAGSPLADLVGERLLLSTGGISPRSCIVYVFQAVTALDADLSLARRAFFELALLAEDTVDVKVEVLA